MNDFLSFRRMITPIFIQILFWIGAGLCIILGIAMIASGAGSRFGGGGMQVLAGVLMLLVGPLLVRVNCEILIVFFRMNDTLTDIRANTAKTGGEAPPADPSM